MLFPVGAWQKDKKILISELTKIYLNHYHLHHYFIFEKVKGMNT